MARSREEGGFAGAGVAGEEGDFAAGDRWCQSQVKGGWGDGGEGSGWRLRGVCIVIPHLYLEVQYVTTP